MKARMPLFHVRYVLNLRIMFLNVCVVVFHQSHRERSFNIRLYYNICMMRDIETGQESEQ